MTPENPTQSLNLASPLQSVRTEEASRARGEKSSRNGNKSSCPQYSTYKKHLSEKHPYDVFNCAEQMGAKAFKKSDDTFSVFLKVETDFCLVWPSVRQHTSFHTTQNHISEEDYLLFNMDVQYVIIWDSWGPKEYRRCILLCSFEFNFVLFTQKLNVSLLHTLHSYTGANLDEFSNYDVIFWSQLQQQRDSWQLWFSPLTSFLCWSSWVL